MTGPRRIDVALDRLERWIAGFTERHGDSTWSIDGSVYLLTGADGAWARLSAWQRATTTAPDLPSWAQPPHHVALLLLRRGGYAVGWASGGQLVRHKTGRRYVQSRTAAGGWSQQRYARRRANQADALVSAVHKVANGVWAGDTPGGLVLGGDRSLCEDVLSDLSAQWLGKTARREFYDLPDPRLAVLKSAVARSQCVAVTVQN